MWVFLVTMKFDENLSFDDELSELRSERSRRRSVITHYPALSVLISTARPDDLTNILHQLSRQTLPQFELILGLHNVKLTPEHKQQIKNLKFRNIAVSSKSFDTSFTLGEILTELASISSGEYVSKMDDDDIYGPEHLMDLLDTALDTGAALVGKAMNYIYLEEIDLTVRRISSTGIASINEWDDWVCGGTILVQREYGEGAGWFGAGKSAVDKFIISGVKRNRGKVFRTFGTGYIYKRSITPQTYVTHYSKYLRGSQGQRVGIWQDSEFGTDE